MFRSQKAKSERELLDQRISRTVRRGILTDWQFILRAKGRIRYVRVPASLQIAGASIVGAFAIWVVHAGYTYVAHKRILSDKDTEIAERDRTNRTLRSELAAARRSFAEVNNSLEKNHRVERKLLGDEVTTLQLKLADTRRRNEMLSRNLENVGSELADALADKSSAKRHGETMSLRVTIMKSRLTALREAQSELLDRLADSTNYEVDRLTKILASTGINVNKMMQKAGGAAIAQGGPFEPASTNGSISEDEALDQALINANYRLHRLKTLQKLTRSLPLVSPLDYYYVASKYGRRKDPINGKSAMHRGVDFGAKHRATVYATAPGKVTYAGWKGRFGRFVAVDHGNGVITRYGHLRRIYVKLGQKIGYRARVGQMGSSGRSTGRHLHYEIQVNGRSIDPLRFMKAGKNVFKG
jgi:murein DD-endopeptidase MepM/ murein hydrolase activator NlpD